MRHSCVAKAYEYEPSQYQYQIRESSTVFIIFEFVIITVVTAKVQVIER